MVDTPIVVNVFDAAFIGIGSILATAAYLFPGSRGFPNVAFLIGVGIAVYSAYKVASRNLSGGGE
jgi:hypothetical protein